MVDIGKSDLFVYTGDNLDPVAKKIANSNDNVLFLSFIAFAIFLATGSRLSPVYTNKSDLVYPLKSFAQQIGGKYVHVESVYPNGMDPHTYEPRYIQINLIYQYRPFVFDSAHMYVDPFHSDRLIQHERIYHQCILTLSLVACGTSNSGSDKDKKSENNEKLEVKTTAHMYVDPFHSDRLIQHERIYHQFVEQKISVDILSFLHPIVVVIKIKNQRTMKSLR
jgi:hypothetical protein